MALSKEMYPPLDKTKSAHKFCVDVSATFHDALEGTLAPPDFTILASSLADAKVALHGEAERLVVEFFSASAKRNWEG